MRTGARKAARWVLLVAACFALLWAAPFAAAQTSQEPLEPQRLLSELQRTGLDAGNSYRVTELYMRQGALRLNLRHGALVFLEPVAGRVTGALFEGAGEILLLPPDLPERQQVVRFTGSPILAESFDTAYLRFTEDTYAALRAELRAGGGEPRHAPELLERWQGRLGELNRAHAVRLLLDFVEEAPPRYFYAGLRGERLGPFEAVLDERQGEQVLVGQPRVVEGRAFYDVWTSFSPHEMPALPPPARGVAYRVEATITPTQALEAVCEVELELAQAGAQVVLFELSRRLGVEEVVELAGSEARPLHFFQNPTMTPEEIQHRGTDVVVVVLPRGETRRRVRFRYRGQIISALGNGVYFVGARHNWHPHVGSYEPARYELRFRYPRELELVATGRLAEERQEGEWKESLWVSERPLPIAGFNLGDYARRALRRGELRVSVYANRQLEPPLLAQLPRPLPQPRPQRRGRVLEDAATPPPVLASPPAEQAERVAQEVARVLEVFSSLFGPAPYPDLKVTQIPGRFGQGYPGLLYVSTLSFLEPADLRRLRVDERMQEHFLQLVQAHEVAHQWWGNWVQLPRYRDQWLAESLAAYSALLYLEQKSGGEAVRRRWLERYRQDLLAPEAGGDTSGPVDSIGPLALGARLNSSRSPNGYSAVVYSKGPWVIHMLRELFRDPQSGSDAAFFAVLRSLTETADPESRGLGTPLTTDEFQSQLEAALPAHADLEGTGKLDWFFEQWVYNTGIPHYKLHWKARPSTFAQGDPSGVEGRADGGAWRVGGSIEQNGVSDIFTMPVPVYARAGKQWTKLGTVVVTGSKVEFRFVAPAKPEEVALDPFGTVLAVNE